MLGKKVNNGIIGAAKLSVWFTLGNPEEAFPAQATGGIETRHR